MNKKLIDFLKKERPELHKTIERQGQAITYIPWNRVVGILDEAVSLGLLASWNYSVDEVSFGGQFIRKVKHTDAKEPAPIVYVKVALGLVHGDGNVTLRKAVGSEVLDATGYGDPISNASAMAFRRAAAMYGIGLYLYEKEDTDEKPRIVAGEPTGATQKSGQKKPVTVDPKDVLVPKPTHRDAPTANQWNYLMKLLKDKRMNLAAFEDLVIQLKLDVEDLEELTFDHVRTLIDYLVKQ